MNCFKHAALRKRACAWCELDGADRARRAVRETRDELVEARATIAELTALLATAEREAKIYLHERNALELRRQGLIDAHCEATSRHNVERSEALAVVRRAREVLSREHGYSDGPRMMQMIEDALSLLSVSAP